MIAQIKGTAVEATARVSGDGRRAARAGRSGRRRRAVTSRYRGAHGLDPEFIKELEQHVRLRQAGARALLPDDGQLSAPSISARAIFRDRRVVDLVIEKMPVSISLGLWTTLLTYLVSIPLGIRKAVRDGSASTSGPAASIIVGNAIPGFLFAILLIVLFAGGSYFDWFPLRGLVSDNWAQLSWPAADRRLFLAPRAADHGAGDRRLRQPDDADQELVPRGDQQAVRA